MGKHHSRAFRESISKLIVDGHRAAHDVALEKGLSDSSISRWVSEYRRSKFITQPPLTQEELEKAKAAYVKEMEKIEKENEILRNTMQFFTGEKRH